MTILDVQQGYSKNTGGWSVAENGSVTGQFSELWQVTHTYDATEVEILSDSRLPQYGDPKTGTTIPAIAGRIVQKGIVFTLVQIDYAKTIEVNESQTNVDWNQSPLSAPAQISWTDETNTEPIDQDINGAPICTVNGEAFKGVTAEIPDPVVTIVRNYASWNPHVTHQYRRSVNSDTFLNFAAGTARLVSAQADLVIDQTFGAYWRVTARVRFRYPYNTTASKTWYARVLHEGFKVKIGPTVQEARQNAGDNSGPLVSTPVLLKSDGTRETSPANAVWLEFQRYYSLPYASLGLL